MLRNGADAYEYGADRLGQSGIGDNREIERANFAFFDHGAEWGQWRAVTPIYLATNAFADVSPNANPGSRYIVQGNRGMPYGRGSTGAIERRFVQLGLKLLF